MNSIVLEFERISLHQKLLELFCQDKFYFIILLMIMILKLKNEFNIHIKDHIYTERIVLELKY